jgi:hypothetical protein
MMSLRPRLELGFGRQLAEDDQVRPFRGSGALCQLLDRIAAVLQDPLSPSMKVILLRHDAVFMNAGRR